MRYLLMQGLCIQRMSSCTLQYRADTVKRDDSRQTQTLGGPRAPRGPMGPQEAPWGPLGPCGPSKRDARVPSKMGGVSLIVAGPYLNLVLDEIEQTAYLLMEKTFYAA